MLSTEHCAILACHGSFGRVARALNAVFKNCDLISLTSQMGVGPRVSLGSLHYVCISTKVSTELRAHQ